MYIKSLIYSVQGGGVHFMVTDEWYRKLNTIQSLRDKVSAQKLSLTCLCTYTEKINFTKLVCIYICI